jgi:hypothetical protein
VFVRHFVSFRAIEAEYRLSRTPDLPCCSQDMKNM